MTAVDELAPGDYERFVRAKAAYDDHHGFDIDVEGLHPILKPHQVDLVRWAVAGGRRAVFAKFGLGKAQPVDEPVLTPLGWRPIGDLEVGDLVIADNGRPTNVIAVHPQGRRPVMRVTMTDGAQVRCDPDHLWSVASDGDVGRQRPWRTITTQQIADSLTEPCGRYRWRVPIVAPIDHPTADVPIEPYALGVLLGDGCLRRRIVEFTCADPEIAAEVEARLPANLRLSADMKPGHVPNYRIAVQGRSNPRNRNTYLAALDAMGLAGKLAHEKFIPALYRAAAPTQRLDLLRGLMDTDGYVAASGTVQFGTSSPELADGVTALVQSLGGTVRRNSKQPTFMYRGERRRGLTHYTLTLRLPNGTVPFLLPRKVDRCRERFYAPLRKIAAVEPDGFAECVCITVDHPSQLYVTSDYVVTHNSVIQLETLRQVLARTDRPGLIVCPLGVRQEFAHDARTLLGVETRFVRRAHEIDHSAGVIHLTNYETIRDGKLDPALFGAISLDEASVLRSFGSKTTVEFLRICRSVPYRFVATATPSPNRYKELLHYAEFLGVMDVGQALTRFFKRDSQKAGNLTIHPHQEAAFWLWVSSWAAFVQRPSDLGHSDDGYEMPDLEVAWHEVPVDHTEHVDVENNGQARLYRGGDLGVVQAAREKRVTLDARVERLMEIIRSRFGPDPEFVRRLASRYVDGGEAGHLDQVVIWCDLNDEQRAIERALDAAGLTYSSVYGSLTVEESEKRIADWKQRRTFALIGKPVMLGQGLNLQQCNTAVFAGITHKFNDLIQACHRIQRYGQTRPCTAHIIYADSEREVRRILMAKWANHNELTQRMSDLIKAHGLSGRHLKEALDRTVGVDRIEASGEGWLVANNDTVLETTCMDDNSVDLHLTSIPFANHYEYTPAMEDFGHTDDNPHFWQQMDYLTPQLLRTLKPGHIYACHVKDRIVFGTMTGAGYSQVSPFHAEAIMHNLRHGFEYMGLIVIVNDVVEENNQSYRLTYSEMLKDGTKMGVGSPEFVLLFRKPQTDRSKGYADEPVTKDRAAYSLARWQIDAHSYWRTNGDRHLTPEEWQAMTAAEVLAAFRRRQIDQPYDFGEHVAIGEALEQKDQLPKTFMLLAPPSVHPDVWTDVNRMRNLNGEQARRNVQQHICPLAFDIVDRLIERYSAPGELVYDPFGGLFTVPVRALHLGRRGRAVELNPGYFADGVKYLQAAERQVSMPTLFDLAPQEAPA